MGIDGIQGKQDRLQVERRYGQNSGPNDRRKTGPVEHDDSVQLSSQTQEFTRIRELIDATPDIRQDRVELLRREIAAGTYNVPSSDIAEAIIDTWI
jgi:flagellar biosynthesis anti-sigma factor FlgM